MVQNMHAHAYFFMDRSAHDITVPSRKRAHEWHTLHWAKIGDGPIFEVSVLRLYAKERPGKLPMVAS